MDCGAGCGSWSWVWVIMVLGVGHPGAGCGKCSKKSAGHKAPQLSAVVGCSRPLETLSILLGRVAGNAIQLSAVVGCARPLETLSFLGGSQAMQSPTGPLLCLPCLRYQSCEIS